MIARARPFWLALAVIMLAQPAVSAELRAVGGACFADGAPGCRPLREASRVRVTYGPAVPLHVAPGPSYVVDHGPGRVPGSEPVVYVRTYGLDDVPVYAPGFFYGSEPRRFHRHHFRAPHRVHGAFRGHRRMGRHAAGHTGPRAAGPRRFMGGRVGRAR